MANQISNAQLTPQQIADATFAAPEATGATIKKSTIGSPVRIVWELADANPGMRRSDLIRLAEAAGIATNTAKTQYQRWFTFRKNERAGTRIP